MRGTGSGAALKRGRGNGAGGAGRGARVPIRNANWPARTLRAVRALGSVMARAKAAAGAGATTEGSDGFRVFHVPEGREEPFLIVDCERSEHVWRQWFWTIRTTPVQACTCCGKHQRNVDVVKYQVEDGRIVREQVQPVWVDPTSRDGQARWRVYIRYGVKHRRQEYLHAITAYAFGPAPLRFPSFVEFREAKWQGDHLVTDWALLQTKPGDCMAGELMPVSTPEHKRRNAWLSTARAARRHALSSEAEFRAPKPPAVASRKRTLASLRAEQADRAKKRKDGGQSLQAALGPLATWTALAGDGDPENPDVLDIAQPVDPEWNPFLQRCIHDTPGTRRARRIALAYMAQKDREKRAR